MKLTKTGWNNVIIFSVMAIIILINATNDKLFPKDNSNNAEQLILPPNSVILTLALNYHENKQVLLERAGRSWELTSNGLSVDTSDNQIEQMIFSWQQSGGLIQASDIVIDDDIGIDVSIALAGEAEVRTFILYPLSDQLLIYKQLNDSWLALPASFSQQLLPI